MISISFMKKNATVEITTVCERLAEVLATFRFSTSELGHFPNLLRTYVVFSFTNTSSNPQTFVRLNELNHEKLQFFPHMLVISPNF